MANLVGNELIEVLGVAQNGMPSGETELTTTQDIANLGGGGGGGSNTTVRSIPSGTTDTALTTDGLIQWLSPTVGAKTERIGLGIRNGQGLQISDGEGSAVAYPITLVGVNCTIGGNDSLTLNDNFFNIVLVFDGLANWIISSYYNGSKTVQQPSYLLFAPGVIMATEDGTLIRLT